MTGRTDEVTLRYCEDCDRWITEEDYQYHNADHSFIEKVFVPKESNAALTEKVAELEKKCDYAVAFDKGSFFKLVDEVEALKAEKEKLEIKNGVLLKALEEKKLITYVSPFKDSDIAAIAERVEKLREGVEYNTFTGIGYNIAIDKVLVIIKGVKG